MSFCDAKGCIVECKYGCVKNVECLCSAKTLAKMMYTNDKYCSTYASNDGVLTFCNDHRLAAGYLYQVIKTLEYLHTNETLSRMSYEYLELIIRLRILFQHTYAHKRTVESSIGHLNRIKTLRIIAKSIRYLNRPLNVYLVGDIRHQNLVRDILQLGYVKIMFKVNNMVCIKNGIESKTETKKISTKSQWNCKLSL